MPDRREVLALCVSGVGVTVWSSDPAAQQAPAPDALPRELWTAILANGRAVPAGHTPVDLLLALGAHFGDPDPVLRDQCGYGITARWVVTEKRLSNSELQRVAAAWLPGLLAQRDPAGGDPVLRRSFSALGLSLIVAADLQQRGLDAATIDALVSRGAEQLQPTPTAAVSKRRSAGSTSPRTQLTSCSSSAVIPP